MRTVTPLGSCGSRLTGALVSYLAQPVAPSGAAGESLREVLKPGDVLLSEGNSRMAALVRRGARSSRAPVAVVGGPPGEAPEPRCVGEAPLAAGVGAAPPSAVGGPAAP